MQFDRPDHETDITTPLKVYCDASRNHENGISSAGCVLTTHNGDVIDTDSCNLGTGYTTDKAEYECILRALKALKGYDNVQHVKVYTDSKNTVQQTPEDTLSKRGFEYVTLDWVPREENTLADMLARRAMKEPPDYDEPAYGISD
jgi:ribonuclease HI